MGILSFYDVKTPELEYHTTKTDVNPALEQDLFFHSVPAVFVLPLQDKVLQNGTWYICNIIHQSSQYSDKVQMELLQCEL